MGLNIDLFRKVHEQITAFPQTHDQSTYMFVDESDRTVCGTTHCIAGWAVVLDAGVARVENKDHYYELVEAANEKFSAYDQFGDVSSWAAGRALLGLSEDEAAVLFAGTLPDGEAVRIVEHVVETGEFPTDAGQ